MTSQSSPSSPRLNPADRETSQPRKAWRWPRALLFAALLLLLLEVGVARQQWPWRFFAFSSTGVLSALEQQVLQQATHPEIIVLGNSLHRDAIPPRLLEEQLGLQRGDVVNVSMTAANPMDFLILYRRNREAIAQANVLLIGLDPRFVRSEVPVSSRTHLFATLDERLTHFSGKDRLSLLLSWAWRSTGYPWREQIEALSKDGPTHTIPLDEQGRVVWHRNERPVSAQEYIPTGDVTLLYRRPEDQIAGDEEFKILGELIEEAQADGLKVVLATTPMRDEYVEERHHRYPELDDCFEEEVEDLRTEFPQVKVLLVEKASEQGISDDQYLDYGHMTLEAAEVYTVELAPILEAVLTE